LVCSVTDFYILSSASEFIIISNNCIVVALIWRIHLYLSPSLRDMAVENIDMHTYCKIDAVS
jgi:dihydrodipicolinate reductase